MDSSTALLDSSASLDLALLSNAVVIEEPPRHSSLGFRHAFGGLMNTRYTRKLSMRSTAAISEKRSSMLVGVPMLLVAGMSFAGFTVGLAAHAQSHYSPADGGARSIPALCGSSCTATKPLMPAKIRALVKSAVCKAGRCQTIGTIEIKGSTRDPFGSSKAWCDA